MSQDQLGLFDTPPTRRQVRVGAAALGVCLLGCLLILPVRNVRVGELDSFVPMVDTLLLVCDLITASLIFAQAAVFRSRALTVLGAGYVYTGLLIVPHMLTFPGVFAPNGLLGAGLDTTAWIAFARRVGFPIALMVYVRLKRREAAAQPETERPAAGVGAGLLAAVALAVAVTLLAAAGEGWLPPYYANRSDVSFPNAVVYEVIVIVLTIAATVLLFRRRSSVLDLWLLVAFGAWVSQSLLITLLKGRFSAGWYGLYALVIFPHLIVMLALIVESNRLYARLALAMSARNKERDDRLMSLDALAAAMAHEIGQPLTAVSLHAKAGMNRLAGPQPHVKMAIKSLRATIEAGRRTTDVVKNLRAVFARRPQRATEFCLNDLVRATASVMSRDLAAHKISLDLELDATLPPILAEEAQIQRVLVSLLTNAIESLSAVRGRPRRITVRTTTVDDQDVRLDVGDNGVGVPTEQMAQIFDAFFTTKTSGSGLGLSLCSTTVESLGGHLWISPGDEHGATFHVQLPSSRFFELLRVYAKDDSAA